jgi:hypothetical protein
MEWNGTERNGTERYPIKNTQVYCIGFLYYDCY